MPTENLYGNLMRLPNEEGQVPDPCPAVLEGAWLRLKGVQQLDTGTSQLLCLPATRSRAPWANSPAC